MFISSIQMLCCPRCRCDSLSTKDNEVTASDIEFGFVSCVSCNALYPVINGILILVSNPRNYVATHRSAIYEMLLGVVCPTNIEKYIRQCAADGAEFDKPETPDESDCDAYVSSHFPTSKTQRDTPITRFVQLLSTISNDYWDILLKELSKAPLSGFLLDIGCSVGGVYHRAMTANHQYLGYFGCDLGFRGVYTARRRAMANRDKQKIPDFEFLVADASELPFERTRISCLLASNMIDVTGSPSETVRHFCNAVPVGGQLVISTPWYWHSGITSIDDPLWSRDSSECLPALLQLVTSILGFRVIATHQNVPWPLTISDRHLRLFLCDLAVFSRDQT